MAALQRLKDAHVESLLKWYAKSQRDFPWRKNPDPYWVWLAEIMSQQTQMATLIPYFYRFIEKFPNVRALAAASDEEVLAAWTGLGYYSRARNIHKAAKKIAGEFGGKFPETVEGWLDLSGVGPYTAAAVASQCFGVSEPVWDGNVVRVCARLDARDDALSNIFRSEMQNALRKKMSGKNASFFNQGMMELGATICTPKSPKCEICPIQSACRAYQMKAVEKYPPPKPRKTVIELSPKVFIKLRPTRDGSYEAFVKRRPETFWFGGMWDFPSELGGIGEPLVKLPNVAASRSLGKTRHQITHHKISLEGWVKIEKTSRDKSTAQEKWLSLDDLTADKTPVPLSTTARKMLKLLMRWINQPQML